MVLKMRKKKIPKIVVDGAVRRHRFSTNMTDINEQSATSPSSPVVENDPLVAPVKPKGNKRKRIMIMDKYLVFRFINKAILILLGYFACYMQWPLLLVFLALVSLVYLDLADSSKSDRIKQRAAASSNTKQKLLSKIDEIPGWVTFPDRERAEWLNQIISQLWPTMNNYIVKLFRGSLQTKIRKKFDKFRFEDIDFGCNPPKIDGVKVYNCATTRDSIIIDFDVFYDGNCDINFSLSGAQMGGIRDFQLSVEVRVVLKPLLPKAPLVGGVQIFFLNTPDINFTLEGISGIPGLSAFIRSKIEERLTKLIVFPNKVTKRFSKAVEASELKALEPAGVLRVHVSEAKELEGKDITGKSDPYCVVYVGAQEWKTPVVHQKLNPKWDYWCEFVILDPMSQHLGFKLYDHDNVNEDDFLGSGDVDISTVIRGQTDQWLKLESAKHGKIHLRFTWLSLSSNYESLNEASKETKQLKVAEISTAILIVYVDSARNLPMSKSKRPNPYFTISVGNHKQKSKTKKHTADPVWEQGFVFLVGDPDIDFLRMTIDDKQTGAALDQFTYRIKELTKEPEMKISKVEFPLGTADAKLVISLQLKILTNDLFRPEDEESESDSESGGFSRQNSVMSHTSNNSDSPSREIIEEEKLATSSFTPLNASRSSSFKRTLSSVSTSGAGEYRLGRIELTFAYSELRQKFLITVHRLASIPLKDPNDIPDPYVKLKLISPGSSSIKNKTKIKMDNCDPVYDETFEYLLSKSDVREHKLIIHVKTLKKLFFNNTIGQVVIDMKKIDISDPYRAWYDLSPENQSSEKL